MGSRGRDSALRLRSRCGLTHVRSLLRRRTAPTPPISTPPFAPTPHGRALQLTYAAGDEPRAGEWARATRACPEGGQNGQEESHPTAHLVLPGRVGVGLTEGAPRTRGREPNCLARPEAPRQGRPVR